MLVFSLCIMFIMMSHDSSATYRPIDFGDFVCGPQIDRETIDTVCHPGNDLYYITFEISGGDPGSWKVDGPGVLTGNSFLSDILIPDSEFTFRVSDDSGCGGDSLVINHSCRCLSEIGELRDRTISACTVDTFYAANYYNPVGQVIAGNDTRNYILTTDPEEPLDHILDQNQTGFFHFDTDRHEVGKDYYIFIILGDQVAGGTVDLLDPCLKMSGMLTATWYEIPADMELVADNEEINCQYPEVLLHFRTEGDTSGFEIKWRATDSEIVLDTDDNGHQLKVTSPGKYIAEFGKAGTDCFKTDTIIITQSPDIPVANIAMAEVFTCARDTVQLSGAGSSAGDRFVYEWSGPGVIGESNRLDVMVNEVGQYELKVRDTIIDCESIEKRMVEQDTTPPEIEIQTPEMLGCGNNTVELSAEGSAVGIYIEYDWNTVTGNISGEDNLMHVDVDRTGIYELVITNYENGCSSSRQVEVVENPNLVDTASIEVIQPSCESKDDGLIVVASVEGGLAPYSYSVDGGATFSTEAAITDLLPGTYPVVVRENTGCSYHDTIQLTAPYEFEVELLEDQSLFLGENVSLQAVTNLPDSLMLDVNWSHVFDTIGSDELVQVGALPLGRHDVQVEISNLNGCIESDKVVVEVLFEKRLFVPNALRPTSVNEANRFLNLFADPVMVRSINRFEVYDRWGRRVFMRENVPVSTELQPDYAWDGFIDGKVGGEGAYIYMAEVEFATGHIEVVKGTIMLVQ